MNSVDLIIIAVILVTVFLGYRKSFIKSFSEWIGLSISLWITLHFFGSFTKFVEKIPGVKPIINMIDTTLLSKLSSLDKEMDFSIEAFKQMDFSKTVIYFFERSSMFSVKEKITFGELSIGLFTNMISIVLLFILTAFVLKAIFNSFDYINKMAGFTSYEKLGSILFSFMKSLVYATLIAFIVYNISVFFNSGVLYDAYHSSALAKLLYSDGLIEWMFGV